MEYRARIFPFVIVLLGLGASTEAELALSPEVSAVGQPVVVKWLDTEGAPVVGARVVATYRPGSRVSETEDLGSTTGDGSIVWQPREAGLVRLEAEGPGGETAVRDVAVRYSGVSPGGIIVLVSAGLILLAGMLVGFFRAGGSAQRGANRQN